MTRPSRAADTEMLTNPHPAPEQQGFQHGADVAEREQRDEVELEKASLPATANSPDSVVGIAQKNVKRLNSQERGELVDSVLQVLIFLHSNSVLIHGAVLCILTAVYIEQSRALALSPHLMDCLADTAP